MNSALNEIKDDFDNCETKNDLFKIIDKISKNCNFIVEQVESLPRRVDSAAILFDNLAVEIFNDVIYRQNGDGVPAKIRQGNGQNIDT
uniref:Herpesvirus U62/UL91 functional domain-containing protein n=2 Tax=Roseolovirus TaxID=40272 RepID=A0A1W6DAK8_9BETA|nr:protein UL91 [Human betaherpesvirus 6B]ARJ98970.1 hypothetical protein [Human betaherpesvirus 6]APO37074.1 protein UL91 [Human betaherpesvirus 6B]APO37158.1 protein UL91 [Human betaherpesvirus 6B]APO37245.1 protein UL91 [Human betaherpesvirus 6B]